MPSMTSLSPLRCPLRLISILTLTLVAKGRAGEASVNWVPAGLPTAPTNGPALCAAGYLTPDQGKAVLEAALARFPNHDAWDAYARHLRERIQQGAGLAPW